MRNAILAVLAAALVLSGCGGYKKTQAGDYGTSASAASSSSASAGAAASAPAATSAGAGAATPAPAAAPAATGAPAAAGPPRIKVETSLGTMVFELWPDKAPKTVDNFLKLARQGFYDGTLFHRVESGFVIQGGDPNTKSGDPSTWGQGGPGYRFEDEPVQGDYVKYSLAMANSGPNTNGSQFFVCTSDLTNKLPKRYNLFGRVVEGTATVDAIDAVPTEVVLGGMHRPVTPVKVLRMTVAP
ncbi:MAG TPA: peptidylprolyl isomerase [Candidatus Saccharimonadales bacterium]|nr:peptidylprolyl isomerase [Candidatus Saccharimonadales bacterium]